MLEWNSGMCLSGFGEDSNIFAAVRPYGYALAFAHWACTNWHLGIAPTTYHLSLTTKKCVLP
jgi:hypothetical protein